MAGLSGEFPARAIVFLGFRFSKIPLHDAGVVGDGDLGIIEFGMPHLLPFETVKAIVAGSAQKIDLLANRNVTATSQNIFAVRSIADRVFQMRVMNPGADGLESDFRRFVGGGESVERIPKQAHVSGVRTAKNFLQHRGRGEIVVRLEQHRDVFCSGILA